MMNFSALVLCGGQGSRVGGEDKGLLHWRGKPMIQWITQQLRPLTDELIISCNRNLEIYQQHADLLVTDNDANYLGPLAGIRAGIAACRHDYLLVLPCDAPLVNTELLMALLECAKSVVNRPVMVRQQNHWQPLFSVIPKKLLDAIEDAWCAGERSPRELMIKLNAVAVECEVNDIRLSNLNTLEQLDEHRKSSN